MFISELYEYCLKEKIADQNLIAKWRKQGYENLCCLRCIQSRDTNFGTNCVCRVPKSKLEEVSWLFKEMQLFLTLAFSFNFTESLFIIKQHLSYTICISDFILFLFCFLSFNNQLHYLVHFHCLNM